MTMDIKALRLVGFLEGLSFLLLVFIAMPMKYIWDQPLLVKYVGMGHGVLFIVFYWCCLRYVKDKNGRLKCFYWALWPLFYRLGRSFSIIN